MPRIHFKSTESISLNISTPATLTITAGSSVTAVKPWIKNSIAVLLYESMPHLCNSLCPSGFVDMFLKRVVMWHLWYQTEHLRMVPYQRFPCCAAQNRSSAFYAPLDMDHLWWMLLSTGVGRLECQRQILSQIVTQLSNSARCGCSPSQIWSRLDIFILCDSLPHLKNTSGKTPHPRVPLTKHEKPYAQTQGNYSGSGNFIACCNRQLELETKRRGTFLWLVMCRSKLEISPWIFETA